MRAEVRPKHTRINSARMCSRVIAKVRDGEREQRLQPHSGCIGGSFSVRLEKRPDVIEVLDRVNGVARCVAVCVQAMPSAESSAQ